MNYGYGYCPICNAPGYSRERRPGGDDICTHGHKYPSRDAKLTLPSIANGSDEEDEYGDSGSAWDD